MQIPGRHKYWRCPYFLREVRSLVQEIAKQIFASPTWRWIGISVTAGVLVFGLLGGSSFPYLEVPVLDFKQATSFRTPRARDVVVSYIESRDGFPDRLFEVTRDRILQKLDEIQRDGPKAVVLFLHRDWEKPVTEEDLNDFFQKLLRYENVYLYDDSEKKYLVTEEPFSKYPRKFRFASRSYDRQVPPKDLKSRRILIHFFTSGEPADILDFARTLTDRKVNPEDFTYGFDYLGTRQVYTKYWPQGSFMKKSGESWAGKIVLLGTADIFSYANARAPVSSRIPNVKGATTFGDDLLFEPEYFATVLTNLTEKSYVKMPPQWLQSLWLFLFTVLLSGACTRLVTGRDVILVFAIVGLGNLIPFLVFWAADWWLHSVPVFFASLLIPYVFLPISIIRLIRKRDQDRIRLEQIQERIRTEAKMAVKNAESQAGFRLATAVAHDIRSPLSALTLISGLLPGEEEKTQVMKKAIARLEGISQSLLRSYRRSSSGNHEPLYHSRSLKENIQSHFGSLFPDIRIEVRIAEPKPVLAVAAIDLERHIFNLLNNSIEAMMAARTSSPTVTVDVAEEDAFTVIRVSDKGPGVPEEIRDRLFQPRATFGKADGHGLALAQARQYFEGLKGSIELEDRPAGASFVIRVPRVTQRGHVPVVGVLVLVDEDVEVLEFLKSQIPPGLSVYAFSDPVEAMSRIELLAKRGDAFTVVSDLVFRNFDLVGFDLLRAAAESQNSCRVLYTSLAEEPQIRDLAERTGVRLFDKKSALLLKFSSGS